jgi:hypothetical protein
LYSKNKLTSLPTHKGNLLTVYGETDEEDVSTDNGVRVSIASSGIFYLIHQYRIVNNTNKDSIKVKINLQSTLAPTVSSVYLQVWNVVTELWETLTYNNSSPAETDFDLEYTITSNVSNYYDSSYEVAFRVYQLNA